MLFDFRCSQCQKLQFLQIFKNKIEIEEIKVFTWNFLGSSFKICSSKNNHSLECTFPGVFLQVHAGGELSTIYSNICSFLNLNPPRFPPQTLLDRHVTCAHCYQSIWESHRKTSSGKTTQTKAGNLKWKSLCSLTFQKCSIKSRPE
jgi:hypothetical protein